MTIDELAAVDRDWLTCQQVASFLGASPATIHLQAIEAPYMLGFRVCVAGNRVRIPKWPFIHFWTEKGGLNDLSSKPADREPA